MRSLIALLLILSASLSQPAEGASPGFADLLTNASAMTQRVVAPTEARIDTAFAPERGAEDLVLRCIDAARGSIRMAAYSLTSPTVVRALVAARKRGIDVQAVVDQRTNLGSDSPVKSKAALNVLVNAGIPVRMISTYAAHHDKYLVVDGV